MAKTSLLVRILRFGAWWYFVSGIICFIVGLGFAASTAIFLARSNSTAGKVVRFEEQENSDHDGVNYAPVFSFVANDGKLYTIQSGVATNPPGFEEGQNVSVLYIKGNPGSARLNSFWQLWFVTVICCSIGIVFALISSLVLYFTQKYVKKSVSSAPPPLATQSQAN
jgi:hypothetical protein